MIKSYPGIGPAFFVVFLNVIGIWMFINPLLDTDASSADLNYGGLLFVAIGLLLTLNFKILSIWGDCILVKQIVTRRQTVFTIAEVSLITIDEDNRSLIEVFFGHKKKGPKIKIQFHSAAINDLVITTWNNTSFHKVSTFLRENYPDLVNYREVESSF